MATAFVTYDIPASASVEGSKISVQLDAKAGSAWTSANTLSYDMGLRITLK